MKYIESYTSKTKTSIRYYLYEPKVLLRVKGVVQIHHALSDHADRYDHFAKFLVIFWRKFYESMWNVVFFSKIYWILYNVHKK